MADKNLQECVVTFVEFDYEAKRGLTMASIRRDGTILSHATHIFKADGEFLETLDDRGDQMDGENILHKPDDKVPILLDHIKRVESSVVVVLDCGGEDKGFGFVKDILLRERMPQKVHHLEWRRVLDERSGTNLMDCAGKYLSEFIDK